MAVRRQKARARPPVLSHLEPDPAGVQARMVDVGRKPVRSRSALAHARLRFPPGMLSVVLAGQGPKGAVTEIARAAGLLAAKDTARLIPMCHPLGLDHLEIRFEALDSELLEVRCRASTRGRTGVEMEALVGAAIAALTVYDMTKALDPGISIELVELCEKRGGTHGPWKRASAREPVRSSARKQRKRSATPR